MTLGWSAWQRRPIWQGNTTAPGDPALPQPPLARAVLIFAVGLALLVLGAAAWILTSPLDRGSAVTGGVTSSGTALVGGPFELVDQHGRTRRDAEFRGRPMLVYFGYTYCPDVCPTSLMAMSQGLDAFAVSNPDLAKEVVPVFVTVDPARDTVATLSAYAPHFHEDLVALTGTAEQVAGAAKAYRVYYAKAEDDGTGDYLMDHSGFIYLMDREGGYRAHFPHSATAEQIAAGLEQHIGS